MKNQYRLFYAIKPVLFRSVQIALRRFLVRRKLRRVGGVWPIDAAAAQAPAGWKGWPSGRRFALVLTHDVEGNRGVERCSRLANVEEELGLVSSFNFVPQRYVLPSGVRENLVARGFEVGVHDLRHDGRLFGSEAEFRVNAETINGYLKDWNAVGFRAGSMYHNLSWMHHMRIEYDSSTFDTDPFEPQPDGLRTVFPLWVASPDGRGGYVELPYTLPQDMTLFVLLREGDSRTWQTKLDWIAERGGMVLLITHPDYMHWEGAKQRVDEYPADVYREFLNVVTRRYRGQYWNPLARDLARYWRDGFAPR